MTTFSFKQCIVTIYNSWDYRSMHGLKWSLVTRFILAATTLTVARFLFRMLPPGVRFKLNKNN